MECESAEINDTNITNQTTVVNTPDKVLEQDSSNDLGESSSSSDTSTGFITPCADKQSNRRYTHKPRKLISKDLGCNLKKLMKTTPKNKFVVQQNLETIFEEPVVTNKGDLVLLGLSKAKRAITFSQFVTQAKLKTRRMKTKKVKQVLAERRRIEDVANKFWKLGL